MNEPTLPPVGDKCLDPLPRSADSVRLLRSSSLPDSPSLVESTDVDDDMAAMFDPSLCCSPTVLSSHRRSSLDSFRSRRGSICSSSTGGSSSHLHLTHLNGQWNSPDSTRPTTPENNEATQTNTTEEASIVPTSDMHERHKAEISADLYNSLRNPCHQLMAFIELLENSPIFVGLIEEREMIRSIRVAAGTIRTIVEATNHTQQQHQHTQQTQTQSALASHSRQPSAASASASIATTMAATPNSTISCGSLYSPLSLKSNSANNSPQMRLPPSVPPSVASSARTIIRSTVSNTTPPSTNESVFSRISRTPPLPAANLRGASTSRFDLTNLNVLIVDDMQLNRKVLRKMLDCIPSVDVAVDGLDAVQLVRARLESHLRVKLPPIPHLDQLMRDNAQNQPHTGEPSPIGTPMQQATPCGTPTATATPTTPMTIMSSPEAPSPQQQIHQQQQQQHAQPHVSTQPSSGRLELPSAEDRVERHHSFPTFTMSSGSSVQVGIGAQIIIAASTSITTTINTQVQPSNLHPPPLTHAATTGATSTTLPLTPAPTPPTGPDSCITSPISPQTPLIMPATPIGMLSPSSRRYTVPAGGLKHIGGSLTPSLTLTGSNPHNGKPQYDVIITDLSMPKLSGHQEVAIIRQLESDLGLPPIPIIAVSSNTLAADRMQCAQGGFTYFLPKPFSRRDIVGVLELIVHERSQQHLSLASLKRSSTPHVPSSHATPPHPPRPSPDEPLSGSSAAANLHHQFLSMLPASAAPRVTIPVETQFTISPTTIAESTPSEASCSSNTSDLVSETSSIECELANALSPTQLQTPQATPFSPPTPQRVPSSFFPNLTAAACTLSAVSSDEYVHGGTSRSRVAVQRAHSVTQLPNQPHW